MNLKKLIDSLSNLSIKVGALEDYEVVFGKGCNDKEPVWAITQKVPMVGGLPLLIELSGKDS